jgi:DNA-binding transcriptional ArsR family regulator
MKKHLIELKTKQDRLFSDASSILSSLGAPVRIKLIHFLSQAPLTVEVLSEKLGQSVANTSMHLRKMLAENILQVEKIGQKRLYSLHPAMFKFWEDCQDFVQKVDPTLRLDEEDSDLRWTYSIRETLKMAQDGELVMVDLRPQDEVIPDKISDKKFYLNIPFHELKDQLSILPKRKNILLLCRGRFCALSLYAVHQLRENGFKAFRFEESWFEINQH